MREILFRGKDLRTGKWEYGFYNHDHNLRGEDLHLIQPVDETGHFTSLRFVDPGTVGQYTGMTDENGRKIFEGDIVEAWSQGVKARGEVRQRLDGFFLMYPAWQNGESWGLCPDFSTGETSVEIIGNIHDSPEMMGLQKEKKEG